MVKKNSLNLKIIYKIQKSEFYKLIRSLFIENIRGEHVCGITLNGCIHSQYNILICA